jgi:hypothetical protein
VEVIGTEDFLEEWRGPAFGLVFIYQHHFPCVTLTLNHLKSQKKRSFSNIR